MNVSATANTILDVMHNNKITFKDLLDAHITNGGIFGVGLITLKDQLVRIVEDHHHHHHKPSARS